jgi:hypothetical protein
MNQQPFFADPNIQHKMQRCADSLMAVRDVADTFRLGQMIKIMISNPAEYDKGCAVNISWIGDTLIDAIDRVSAPLSSEAIDDLTGYIYRFMAEFDISMRTDLPMEVRQFMRSTENRLPSMPQSVRDCVEFAQNKMPIAILKHLLNESAIGTIRDISAHATNLDKKIDSWEQRLAENSSKAETLAATFAQHTSAFNFVGLHKGFEDLAETIQGELTWAQRGMWLIGPLILLPGLYDLYLSLWAHQDFQKMSLYTLIAAGLGTFTLTLLFLYFFRIMLRKADSCRAQLVQVRLRMSLCRFIQSYADYSKEIRGKNPDALAKFESLIFSGIVGTAEKLPSTFDGIEQLSAFAKSLREK